MTYIDPATQDLVASVLERPGWTVQETVAGRTLGDVLVGVCWDPAGRNYDVALVRVPDGVLALEHVAGTAAAALDRADELIDATRPVRTISPAGSLL